MSKLLFVYNAKSDILNSAFDFAHKIISPATYNCNLCKLTHNNFSEKKEWIDFRETSKHDLEFLHIDEFERIHDRKNYPAVFELVNDNLNQLISPDELNEINSTEELIAVLKTK
ncbi:MAG: GTPase [Flavobacteriales bacterium]